MRDQTPPDRAAAGRLRPLPGFRAAVVVFLATVLVGGGTIAAVANWQQSATATIAITAGAPATPPPAANVVTANPVLAPRPDVLDPGQVTCQPVPAQPPGSTTGIKFTWPAAARATSYVVSLAYDDKGYSFPGAAVTTPTPTAAFTLQRSAAAYGHYVVRVLPMNGAVAGDPIYRTYEYSPDTSGNCYYASPDGRSPLAVPALSTQTLVKGPTTAALPLSWTGAAGTSYVVTLVSATSGYGMEATVGGAGITVTFPRAAGGQGAPFYSNYSLRIQPVKGTTVGDPVYKTVQYYDWGSGLY